jgi:hypothetical protein
MRLTSELARSGMRSISGWRRWKTLNFVRERLPDLRLNLETL